MKKIFLIAWLFTLYGCSKCQIYGYLWANQHPIDTTEDLPISLLHDLLFPTVGTLIITDTQTVNSWTRAWSAETTVFYDSATSNIKIYHTGGSDSLGGTAFNNKIGLVTSNDMTTFSTPIKVFGQGLGSGVPIDRRATSSWVGKIGNKYYALALNGFPGIIYNGQDSQIYGYTSDNGTSWTDAGVKVNKTTAWSGGSFTGLGNSGVCVNQYNTPQVIGGKYLALFDAWNGSAWVTYRAEADSIMGNWTFTNALTSLKVGAITTYGSCQIIYYNGLYFCFYLYGAGGATPSKLVYATSSNSIDWTIREAPFMGIEATPYGAFTDQIADVNFVEINGKVYMTANYCRNSSPFMAQVRLWTYDGTFAQMISQLDLN